MIAYEDATMDDVGSEMNEFMENKDAFRAKSYDKTRDNVNKYRVATTAETLKFLGILMDDDTVATTNTEV